MKKAIIEIPSADYDWFEKLIQQQGWTWEWIGDEYPDYVED